MITNKLSIFINNKLGLYSKRQCVDIATNIGKELVDLSSSGAELTTDLFQKTIKKYGKKINVKNIVIKKIIIGFLMVFANIFTNKITANV